MICDGFYLPFIYSFKCRLAIMPDAYVVNNISVFARTDLTNKSLQIGMRLPPPPVLLSMSHVFVLNRCPAVCADKSGGCSSGYL